MEDIQLEQDLEVCHLCGEKLSNFSRGKTFHAVHNHRMTPEQFVRSSIKSVPTCQCGCGKEMPWRGWTKGFSKYAQGHMSKSSRDSGKEKLSMTLRECHWAKGLSKETSEVILTSSKKISISLKQGFSNGSIKHWALGLTSQTDVRLEEASRKRSQKSQGKNHWKFMDTHELMNRISSSIGDRFDILSGGDTIENRKNNRSHFIEIKCRKCDLIDEISIFSIIRNNERFCRACRSPECSVPQKEIEEFVRNQLDSSIKILSSDRTNPTGYELDVYVPQNNFAIEFNGLYWHSELIQESKNYHDDKTKACIRENISLLHVFDDEWREKRSIVESMIRHKLGLSKRIWARKCSIAVVDKEESKIFFNENHIDGDTKGFITYGLFFEGTLVSAIKMRAPFSKRWKGSIEIARFASLRNLDIVGGYSKLIKFIKKNHCEQIISYVDTRFGGTGKHCEKANMKLDHTTGCSFWWTDRVNRFNRLYCKAGDGKTEAENAKDMKLLKIWGCANLVYVL